MASWCAGHFVTGSISETKGAATDADHFYMLPVQGDLVGKICVAGGVAGGP
jgi:hypothetical protein